MNLLDLFSGIGGFHLGLEQAGFKFDWVGFSDIDNYANKLYKRRFKDAEELGDIKSIQPERLPDIDLVTFGFPCQDLSIAGKRGGLQANRSSLFFEAMRIVGAKRPKNFICPALWRGAILYNGDLQICTADFEGEYVIGNILREKSFEKVFYGKKARSIREQIIKQNAPLCKTCAVIDKDHFMKGINRKFAH